MGVNLQDYLKNSILGNVRIGAKDERGLPIKIDHFDVHTDNTTSELAVEVFNEKYNKPKSLKIKFINQNPMEIFLERYEGRKRKCYGNGNQAKCTDDKGKVQVISCAGKACPYKESKQCKFVAKLYFLIQGLEDEGVWCFPIGGEKGIKKISKRIFRANRLGEDLTQHWYELFLKAEDAPGKGVNYIPDIRKLEEVEQSMQSEKKTNSGVETPKNQTQNNNYLMIKGFEKVIFDNKNCIKINYTDTASKDGELFLLPESNQEILKLKPSSIILPSSISRRDNYSILNNYKIIKAA